MSKEETVEVTIKVAKRLMQVLEAEGYFGWSKEDFWVACVKRGISCEVNELDIDELKTFEKKHGEVDVVTFDLVKRLNA